LNTTTGVATQIGTGVASTDLILDLSVNCAGEMFGVNTVTDRLVRIDTTNGTVTTVNAANSIGIDVPDSVNGNGMGLITRQARSMLF